MQRARRICPVLSAAFLSCLAIVGLFHMTTVDDYVNRLHPFSSASANDEFPSSSSSSQGASSMSIAGKTNAANDPDTTGHGKAKNTARPASTGTEDNSFDTLMKVYHSTYNELKVIPENVPTEICPPVLKQHRSACVMKGCNTTFPPLQQRLRRVLQTQQPITARQRKVIDNLANHPKYTDLVFVTAASANHFEESQGVIRDLYERVFPWLRGQGQYSFRLFYHDLGLNPNQLKKLITFCKSANCTVLSFPFRSLSYEFRKLHTCIWKPLLVKAHLRFSRITLWMDASTRFKQGDINGILQQANQLGVFVTRDNFMLPMHVHPAMLTYFQVQACPLASFYEIAAGFVVVRNTDFVHKAIVDPWVACAFSPKCLCPSVNMTACESFIRCTVRDYAYFRCHRYDQAALGIILSLLFDWRISRLAHYHDPWINFTRGNNVKYIP